MNKFGSLFTLTSFGESHGVAVGGVIDGMPAGVAVDMGFIQSELDRRKPGQSSIVVCSSLDIISFFIKHISNVSGNLQREKCFFLSNISIL